MISGDLFVALNEGSRGLVELGESLENLHSVASFRCLKLFLKVGDFILVLVLLILKGGVREYSLGLAWNGLEDVRLVRHGFAWLVLRWLL